MSLKAVAIVVASALPRADTRPGPVTAGDVAGGSRHVHQRPAGAPAEDQTAGQRQREGADAGEEQGVSQLVEKCLCRRPVLEQQKMTDVCRRVIAEQRKRAFDEFAAADPLKLRGDAAVLGASAPATASPGRDRCSSARSGCCPQGASRDESDVGAGHLRQFLCDTIVQREPERDGAEHLGRRQTSRVRS